MTHMLTEKEQKIKAMYEKQLRVPKLQYIILYGVVLWGGTMLLMLTLMDRFAFNRPFDRESFIVRLLLMPFAGVFLGWFMRRLSVKRLAKLIEKEKEGKVQ